MMYQSKTGCEWAGKRVLVVGLARSGIAAANLLLHIGAKPILYDEKYADIFIPELDRLIQLGCHLALHEELSSVLEATDILLISPGVPLDAPIVRMAAARKILCIGELELGSQFVKSPIYAITGTNGKTTTVSLLEAMFIQAGYQTQACGNIGFPISLAALSVIQNAPLPVEVSSFQMETAISFHPYAAAVLNISPDHLNRHGSMERYIELKRDIFRHQNAKDFTVLNADDKIVCAMADGLPSHVVWFSRLSDVEEGSYLKDGHVQLRLSGKVQTICKIEDVKIRGAHNLENALAATVMAGIAGIPPKIISWVLENFSGVEHRIEQVRKLNKVNYINDSKGTNTASTIKAIEAMDDKTVLLAGGYDKKESFKPLAEVIANNLQIIHVIVFGQTALKIEKALFDLGYNKVSRSADMFEAIKLAREYLGKEGGTVLLSPACASFDQFSDYEQRGTAFKSFVNALDSNNDRLRDV